MSDILGFEPFSLCDFPGKTSCVVYIGGCNFNCPTCHNWMIANKDKSLYRFRLDEIFLLIYKHRKFLSGITITGGEPTIIPGILPLVKELSYVLPVKLDTNGMNPLIVYNIINYVELIAVDIKAPFNRYNEFTHSSFYESIIEKRMKAIFEIAKSYKKKFYFRTTLVPGLNEKDIEEIRSYIPDFELHLQQYRPVRRIE